MRLCSHCRIWCTVNRWSNCVSVSASGDWPPRAARRQDEQLSVEIWGAVPVVGHEIEIDGFAGRWPYRQQGRGRRANEQIAEAVQVISIDRGESPTRRAVATYVMEQTGRRPSNTTLDRVMRSIRQAALASCVSLDHMAEIVIAGVREMRAEHLSTDEAVRVARLNPVGPGRQMWLARARLIQALHGEQASAGPLARRAGP